MTPVRVYLLGRFEVVLGDRAVPDGAWQRRKARQLFKCLLSRPGRRLTKDEAVELFWPESDAEAAATNLRSTVHAIRRALAQPGDPSGLVVVDRDTVGLRADAELWVDAEAFERALADARRAADPVPLLEQASALYAGDYLPDDLYEGWSSGRREALKRAWSDLQFSLVRLAEERGDPDAAVAALERLLGADPCDERAGQELIRLFLRQGRRADALRAYQRLARSLREELGVEPSEATVALQRQASGVGSRESGVGSREGPSPAPSSQLPTPTPFVCAHPFPAPGRLIGRRAALERLEQVLERGRAGGQAVLLDAPAGTGKSTLVGVLVRRARRGGVLCLAGGCYEQRGIVPLGPFQDALADYLLAQPAEQVRVAFGAAAADLARVVPELRYHLDLAEAAPAPAPPEGSAADRSSERVRQFGAVHACLRALAAHGPVLLCLEDLHAADAATLELFHYLARQTRRLPLVLLGTFRTEEAPAGQPLARLLAALSRERLAERLRLGPLDRAATGRLLATLLDGPASEQLTASLFEATEGNPLFVEQLVLDLREEGGVARRAGVWHQTAARTGGIPTIVREVIGQRLDRVSERCRETLAMAAVLGQSVPHGLLVESLGPSDEAELLADLDEALGAQLLQETAAGYAFGHALLRETVYWSISAPRRVLLHARAGETLERLAGPRAVDRAAELAHHFGLAERLRRVRAKALHYSLEAGRHAADLSAHREALVHFTRACDLIERDGEDADPATRLAALEGRGHAERELAMWNESIRSFRRVLELSDDPIRRALARAAIGFALHHTVAVADALAECDAGLAELGAAAGPEAAVARLRLQASKSIPLFVQGRFRALEALGHEMIGVATELDRPRPLTWGHNAVGLSHMARGQVEPALEHFGRALAAAERADDKVLLAIAHENLGHQHLRAGELDRAEDHLGRALALYRDSAAESRAVLALQALGRLHLARGDLERAREQAELGCALATEANDRWAAECLDLLGAIHTRRADWEAGAGCFDRALAIRERVGHAAGLADSLLGLGLLEQRRGDWQRARELYTRAVGVADAIDPSPQAVAARRHLGRLLLLSGDRAAAEREILAAAALARQMPRSIEHAATLLALAELRRSDGDLAGAIDHAERALAGGLVGELAAEARLLLAEARALGADSDE